MYTIANIVVKIVSTPVGMTCLIIVLSVTYTWHGYHIIRLPLSCLSLLSSSFFLFPSPSLFFLFIPIFPTVPPYLPPSLSLSRSLSLTLSSSFVLFRPLSSSFVLYQFFFSFIPLSLLVSPSYPSFLCCFQPTFTHFLSISISLLTHLTDMFALYMLFHII